MTDDEVTAMIAQGTLELRAAFDLIDTDGDGRIDAVALRTGLAALGHTLDHVEASKLIALVDDDHDGHLGFHEFVLLIEPRLDTLDAEEEALDAFAVLDRDGDGFLSAIELMRASPGMQRREADAMVSASDDDGDGRLSFAEFRRAMQR